MPTGSQVEEKVISEQEASDHDDSDELESSSDEDWTKKKVRRNVMLSKKKPICKQKSPVEKRQLKA